MVETTGTAGTEKQQDYVANLAMRLKGQGWTVRGYDAGLFYLGVADELHRAKCPDSGKFMKVAMHKLAQSHKTTDWLISGKTLPIKDIDQLVIDYFTEKGFEPTNRECPGMLSFSRSDASFVVTISSFDSEGYLFTVTRPSQTEEDFRKDEMMRKKYGINLS